MNVPAIFTWIFWFVPLAVSHSSVGIVTNRVSSILNYRLFRPLVSAQTLAKMSVVGTGPATIGKELLPVVDKSELPARYGGEAKAF